MLAIFRILLLFMSCTAVPVFAAQPLDKIIATVDTEIITASELNSRLETWQKQMPPQDPVSLQDQNSQHALEKQVLDSLINERLQILAAERYGISLNASEIDQAIAAIAARNHMDLNQFHAALAKEGMDYTKFRENLRKEMLIGRVQQRMVISKIVVQNEEIDDFLKNSAHLINQKQEYHLGHILIEMSENPTPAELKKAQQKAEQLIAQLRAGANFSTLANQYSNSSSAAQGGDLGWYKAAELPSLFVPLIPKLKIGEVGGPVRNTSGLHIVRLIEVRAQTEKIEVLQTRVSHILIQANEIVTDAEAATQLTELKNRIHHGEDFATLARTYSADPGSAKNGGSLGWIDAQSNLDPVFFTVVQNTPVGTISPPFKTAFGWHIVQVEAQRHQDQTTANQRQAARRMLQNSKVLEAVQIWLNQLRDEAHIDILQKNLQNKEDE